MFAETSGVVFDLDGTLVRLRVPWDEVEESIRVELAERGIDTTDRSVWTLLDAAWERGQLDAVEPTINAYEIDGAEHSERLALADAVARIDVPVGVCSLNCEAACRRALDVHALDEAVDVVVGRDTVRPWKPDPAPLTHAIAELGRRPDDVVFIGDSARDARTADAAGVTFHPVSDVLETLDEGSSG